MNLLSAAVMQVQADKSEVIAPVLPPVIIRSSSWSHWLFLEALSEQCPALSQPRLPRGCSRCPQCSGAAAAPRGPEGFVGTSTAACRAFNWDNDTDHSLAALAGLVLE